MPIDIVSVANEIARGGRRGGTVVSMIETQAFAVAVLEMHTVLLAAAELTTAFKEKELAVVKTPGLDGRIVQAAADLDFIVTEFREQRGFETPTEKKEAS